MGGRGESDPWLDGPCPCSPPSHPGAYYPSITHTWCIACLACRACKARLLHLGPGRAGRCTYVFLCSSCFSDSFRPCVVGRCSLMPCRCLPALCTKRWSSLCGAMPCWGTMRWEKKPFGAVPSRTSSLALWLPPHAFKNLHILRNHGSWRRFLHGARQWYVRHGAPASACPCG